jgi:hypothetical protein
MWAFMVRIERLTPTGFGFGNDGRNTAGASFFLDSRVTNPTVAWTLQQFRGHDGLGVIADKRPPVL